MAVPLGMFGMSGDHRTGPTPEEVCVQDGLPSNLMGPRRNIHRLETTISQKAIDRHLNIRVNLHVRWSIRLISETVPPPSQTESPRFTE
jgi:hypothetical protein